MSPVRQIREKWVFSVIFHFSGTGEMDSVQAQQTKWMFQKESFFI